MELCTKWGIHGPNLTRRIAFLHWCTQYGRWDWIRACASAICGNCCTAEMRDWGGEHIAQHLWCWTRLPHWNAHVVKHERCPSARRVWLVQPTGNWMVCKRAMFVCFGIFDCKQCIWRVLSMHRTGGQQYLVQQTMVVLKLHKYWWRKVPTLKPLTRYSWWLMYTS